MTTTEQYISTGSLLCQGLRPGMARGMLESGTFSPIGEKPNLWFVRHDPSGVLPATAASDIAYDIGTGSFLMAVGGVHSMDWIALQST